jgi:hypothetical protein
MPPWAIEEMSCVYYYLVSLIRRYLDDVEDQIVRAALSASGGRRLTEQEQKCALTSATENHPLTSEVCPWSRGGEDDLVPFESLGRSKLHFLSERPVQPSFLASFGLRIVREAIDNTSQRWDILKQKASLTYNRDFLPEALQDRVWDRKYSTMPQEAPGDVPSQPGYGYHLFRYWGGIHREMYLPFYSCGYGGYGQNTDIFHPLRERGYVFWDLERLATSTLKRSLQKAEEKYREEHNRTHERRRESLEKRLKGVVIPRSQMDNIVSKFGVVKDY